MKARKKLVRTVAAATAAGALAWLALTGAGVATAGGASTDATAMKGVAEEGPGYAVEDFGYPNADKILAEQNIILKRGDGHILLADCASASDLLEIWSRADVEKKICFKVTGTTGYLALEIPSVFVIKGNDYSTQVNMKTGAEEKTWDIKKNTWTSVGESDDEQARKFALMEIRTSK
ncbi:hypothetical protein ABT237_39150 [Streptomyces sp. NPDC001581]|uniref:hypothetical protein n=1 Tax=Streptomyces sp. NPDC001581 TaxID=3154386 RepID=UPI00331E4A50